jgi:transposase
MGCAGSGSTRSSYKRGHRHLIVVVDHDTGHLVWGRTGPQRRRLTRVLRRARPRTRRAAHPCFGRYGRLDRQRAANAIRSADPFHVVAWAIDALDIERRRAWNQAKGRHSTRNVGRPHSRATGDAKHIAQARYALWKNPGDLTGRQRHQLDWIAKTDPRLWRAYLLKEGLRYVFAVKGDEGKLALDQWTDWARRSRIPSFVHLQRKIATHRQAIDAALDTRLSQGLVESTDTKIRLLTRIAYGFHGHQPLVALAMLALGAHRPHLPGRD